MSKRQYFGTDGIRGRVGQAPMTVDFIMKLGWAAGKVLSKASGGQVVITNVRFVTKSIISKKIFAVM